MQRKNLGTMFVILLLLVAILGYGYGGVSSRDIVRVETTTSEATPSGEYRRHNLFANSLGNEFR